MDDLPNNLRAIREGRGLTLQQLADLVRPARDEPVDPSTISKLELGKRKLSTDWMDRLSDALGVSPADLLKNGVSEPVRRVPLVGAIAAGNWREAIEDATGLIPCMVGGPNTFALRPSGDSMDLVVREGAIIFVDPDDRELRDRKYYAMMRQDGDTTFKQFRTNPLRLEPCSSNPANRTIMMGEEALVTVGRVVGQESEL